LVFVLSNQIKGVSFSSFEPDNDMLFLAGYLV